MEETYTLTMEQIQSIVKNALLYKSMSGYDIDGVLHSVPGIVGFVVYQTGLR